MLENLLPGWAGKFFVLVLLGFAGTDFIITMTLSAADAAQHAIENPYLNPYLGEHRIYLTVGLLALLAAVFLKGFREAIHFAVAVAVPYLVLNLIVLIRSVSEILRRPELIHAWDRELLIHGDWTMLLIASALIFPRLALGMSGFETGFRHASGRRCHHSRAYSRNEVASCDCRFDHEYLSGLIESCYDSPDSRRSGPSRRSGLRPRDRISRSRIHG